MVEEPAGGQADRLENLSARAWGPATTTHLRSSSFSPQRGHRSRVALDLSPAKGPNDAAYLEQLPHLGVFFASVLVRKGTARQVPGSREDAGGPGGCVKKRSRASRNAPPDAGGLGKDEGQNRVTRVSSGITIDRGMGPVFGVRTDLEGAATGHRWGIAAGPLRDMEGAWVLESRDSWIVAGGTQHAMSRRKERPQVYPMCVDPGGRQERWT